jgi:hypothetical protein
MEFHEKRVACPECSKPFAVEYLAPGTDGTNAFVSTLCPHCNGSVRAEIPTDALVFSARLLGAARNSSMRAATLAR